jgi:PadR family transcriptional regulator AphA
MLSSENILPFSLFSIFPCAFRISPETGMKRQNPKGTNNLMTLELAILGLLSLRPQTGYEIKKTFVDSPILYWSGSNNQIYHTLVRLHQQGLLSRQVQLQEDHPSRKIYTITESGRNELKRWVQVTPEPPQLKQPFFIQLAWADLLEPVDLDALLVQYEGEVQMQFHLLETASPSESPALRRKQRSGYIDPTKARTAREAILWKMIQQNRRSFYENELAWVKKLRETLNNL